jgi:hypothetical protein
MMKNENIVLDCRYTVISGDGLHNCCYTGFDTGITIYNQRYGKISKSKDNVAIKSYEVLDEESIGIVPRPLDTSKLHFADSEYGNGRMKRSRKMSYDSDGQQTNTDKITCDGVVNDLLFNRANRERIDQNHQMDMSKKAKQEIKRYIKECNNKMCLPNLNEASRKYDCFMNTKARLILMQTDNRITEFYSTIILKVWEMIFSEIHNTNSNGGGRFDGFNFKKFAVALMYMLPDGVSVREMEYNEESQQSSPSSSLAASIDNLSVNSDNEKKIKIQLVNDKDVEINYISIDDSDEEQDFVEETPGDYSKIQIVEPDEFLALNLPPMTAMKELTCSISSSNSYTKKDITDGLKWIMKELRNFKNMEKARNVSKWIKEHVVSNKNILTNTRANN